MVFYCAGFGRPRRVRNSTRLRTHAHTAQDYKALARNQDPAAHWNELATEYSGQARKIETSQ
jgi:hypothetical protein